MKSVLGTVLVCVAMTAAYLDIDDNYDYESVLRNTTQLNEFLGCFLDKTPCSDVEQHIKIHIHDAVVNLCADCDDLQRHYARAMDVVLQEKYPEDYERYKAKYDPEGNHYSLFLKAIAKY